MFFSWAQLVSASKSKALFHGYAWDYAYRFRLAVCTIHRQLQENLLLLDNGFLSFPYDVKERVESRKWIYLFIAPVNGESQPRRFLVEVFRKSNCRAGKFSRSRKYLVSRGREMSTFWTKLESCALATQISAPTTPRPSWNRKKQRQQHWTTERRSHRDWNRDRRGFALLLAPGHEAKIRDLVRQVVG